MALDFPNTPTVGQVYGNYTWDGEKWVNIDSGGGDALGFITLVPQSSDPPLAQGRIFQRASDGKFYVCEDGLAWRQITTTP